MALEWVADGAGSSVRDDELPHVAVVLLNWNQASITIECLESLFRLDYPRYTVVLCDNASTDGSARAFTDWATGRATPLAHPHPELVRFSHPPVAKPVALAEYTRADVDGSRAGATTAPFVLLHASDNLGFTGGNNLAMRYVAARGDIPVIWILNNDTVVAPDSLRELVRPLVADPGIGAVGATMFEYRSPAVIQAAAGGAFSPRQLFPSLVGARELAGAHRPRIDFISGACVLLRTRHAVEVGMLDDIFYIYGEDVDLSLKVERLGLRLMYAPRARIWHKGGGDQGYGNVKHDYYTTRNTLMLLRKYYPRYLPYALVYMMYRVIAPKVVRRQRKRLEAVLRAWRDFASGTVGKVAI